MFNVLVSLLVAGEISKVEFATEDQISTMMSRAGVFNPNNKVDGGSRYDYISKEGKGGGKFDFFYTGIPQMYPGASKKPLAKHSTMIYLVDGVAHNHMNFGNFLFGAAGGGLGLSLPELLAGAHYNSIRNCSTNGYSPQLDSWDDQYSIMKGFDRAYSNSHKEREAIGRIEVGPSESYNIFPSFPLNSQ